MGNVKSSRRSLLHLFSSPGVQSLHDGNESD